MRFVKSDRMKVSVLKEQEVFLSPKDKISKYVQDNDNLAFDIICEGDIIGFALLRNFDEGCYFLWDYAIDAKFQNRRYGTLALKELIQWMKTEYKMHTLTTTYKWGNQQAKRLYENMGFTETDVVYENGIHEINMVYTI